MNIKLKPKKVIAKKKFRDIAVGQNFTTEAGFNLVKVLLDDGSIPNFFGLDKTSMYLAKIENDVNCTVESDHQALFSELRSGVLFSYRGNAFVKRENESYASLVGKADYIFPDTLVTILIPDINL